MLLSDATQKSSTHSLLKFFIIFIFIGVVCLLVHHREIDRHSDVALEMKLVHRAQTLLGQAFLERASVGKELQQGAALLELEEKLIKQAAAFLKEHDMDGFTKTMKDIEPQVQGAKRILSFARSDEVKARADEMTVEQLMSVLESQLNATQHQADLIEKTRVETDMLKLLNSSLAELEAVDQTLQSRQDSLHTQLERLRHGAMQEDQVGLVAYNLTQETESEATNAERRANRTLEHVGMLLRSGNSSSGSRSSDEQLHKLMVRDALHQVQSLWDSTSHALKESNVLDAIANISRLDPKGASVTLTQLMEEMQNRHDAMRQKRDFTIEYVRLEDERRKKILDENKRISEEARLQKHALALKARAIAIMKKEEENMDKVEKLLQGSDDEGAAAVMHEMETDNLGLMDKFAELKQYITEAREQEIQARKLSNSLRSHKMASLGGQEVGFEEKLSSLQLELGELESWEGRARTRHNEVLSLLDSIQQSQNIG